jgi:membrane protease YdiL (CAAX protease family)
MQTEFFLVSGWVLTLFMCQTTWFLKDAIPPSPGQYLPTPVYGVGFMFFGLYFLIAFGLLFYQMFQSNRRLKGREKAEIEYLLLSCGAGLFIGIFFLIVPSITGWNDLGAMLPLRNRHPGHSGCPGVYQADHCLYHVVPQSLRIVLRGFGPVSDILEVDRTGS